MIPSGSIAPSGISSRWADRLSALTASDNDTGLQDSSPLHTYGYHYGAPVYSHSGSTGTTTERHGHGSPGSEDLSSEDKYVAMSPQVAALYQYSTSQTSGTGTDTTQQYSEQTTSDLTRTTLESSQFPHL